MTWDVFFDDSPVETFDFRGNLEFPQLLIEEILTIRARSLLVIPSINQEHVSRPDRKTAMLFISPSL
jgi:hypothetical protein